jgi:hypothetical protein
MSKIKVDLSELIVSFGFDDEELAVEYFDKETGDIINIPRNVRKVAEGDLGEEALDDWEKELLVDAEAIFDDMEDRYLVIPTIESHYFYEAMEMFTEECVTDSHIKGKLRNALGASKPMREFKNAVSNYEEIQNLWYDYEDRKAKEYVIDWLQNNDVEFEEA